MRAFMHSVSRLFSSFSDGRVFLPISYSQDTSTYFDEKYVKRHRFAQRCAFGAPKTIIQYLDRQFPRTPPFLDLILTGLKNFRLKTGLSLDKLDSSLNDTY